MLQLFLFLQKKGTNVHKIFPLLKEVYIEYNKFLATNYVTDFFREAYSIRIPKRMQNGRLVMIKKSKQVASGPPKFHLLLNKYGSLDKSYLKYLENNLRAKFGFHGTPIKIVWDDDKVKS